MTYDYIFEFLRKNLAGKKAVIGLSGGIDSSLVSAFLAKSIPVEDIIPVFMPERGTPERDYNDVRKLCEKFKLNLIQVNIEPVIENYMKILPEAPAGVRGNLKSRTRMTILYYYANLNGGLVVGTTNLTEYITGYYTKFGDGGCDLEPIINLTKTEVRAAAKAMGIPESIITKPPTAGLWEGQTDESEMGLTYDDIDKSIDYFRSNGKFGNDDVSLKVRSMYEKNAHKRGMPLSPGEEKVR